MFSHTKTLETFGWKSIRLLKKKAMEQEPSWSGLTISLSIAFFIVALTAGLLNVAYHSIERQEYKTIHEGIRSIGVGALARVFITEVQAASENEAQPTKDTHFLTFQPGQTSSLTISYKNTGSTVWTTDMALETGPYLKTVSKLETTGWKKFHRPILIPRAVKPGQKIDITFPIKAPTEIFDRIQENFQLVINERPVKGSLVRVFVTVKPAAGVTSPQISNPVTAPINPVQNQPSSAPNFCISAVNPSQYNQCNTNSAEQPDSTITIKTLLPAEPFIRVGLYAAPASQRVTFDSIFDVISGSETLFSGVASGQVITASYNPASRAYAVALGAITKTAASPIRFVPRTPNAVATLLDSASTDNRFRNVIEFRYTEPAKKVWLINELPLEFYIKGLGETSNLSPIEFQKVMATAARSYVLYHYLRGVQYNLADASTKHAADHYHIDAYYDQVYRGYKSELRLPRLTAAVDATRGVVVAYNEQPVITPYFSNSDGRTRDWTEIWGGSGLPWLKSVTVLEDKGQTLYGHGVGMSARGALLMTNAGKSWQDALTYFYTGTNLLKIY